MKKITIFIAIFALILASCSITSKSERAENRRQAKCIKYGCLQGGYDSVMKIVETKTIYRDTTIIISIPGKIIHDTLKVNVDHNGLMFTKKSVLNTSYASSWAWVDNGKLYHELYQHDTLIAHKIKNAIKEVSSTTSEHSVKALPNPMQTKHITGFQHIMIIFGYVFCAIIIVSIIYIVFQIKKYFKSI